MSQENEVDSCHYLDGLITVDSSDVGSLDREYGRRKLTGQQLQEFLKTKIDVDTLNTIVEETPVYRVDADPRDIALSLDPIKAAPIYAVGFEGHSGFMPGTPAEGIADSMKGETKDTVGVICVVDSGIADRVQLPAWMRDPFVCNEGIDVERIHRGERASHGTFVTGLIRRIAPAHQVFIAKAEKVPANRFHRHPNTPPHDEAGVPNPSTEIEVGGALDRLVNRLTRIGKKPTVLNLSLGAYRCDNGGAHMQIMKAALKMWVGEYDRPPDEGEYDTNETCEIFAAAGNSPRGEEVYPAVFGDVRGVGAARCMDPNQIVWDQNYNPIPHPNNPRAWANDTAPGSDLINVSGRPHGDLVKWSGSSFATAVASALYARAPRPRNPAGVWWPNPAMDCGTVPNLSYVDANGVPKIK